MHRLPNKDMFKNSYKYAASLFFKKNVYYEEQEKLLHLMQVMEECAYLIYGRKFSESLSEYFQELYKKECDN